MALKGLVFVASLCFFDLANATYCSYSSDCYGYREWCCSDGICREKCFPQSCSYNSQCGTGECCNSNGDCKTSCSYYNGGAVGGIIFGCVFVVGVIACIVGCYYCACCPYYRYRSRATVGTVVVQPIAVTQQTVQPVVSRTTTQRITRIQHSTPSGYNPGLAGGYDQPPPPYVALPPLQVASQDAPTSTGQTVKAWIGFSGSEARLVPVTVGGNGRASTAYSLLTTTPRKPTTSHKRPLCTDNHFVSPSNTVSKTIS